MRSTPEWLQAKIRAYYQATNETSYLANWSGNALGLNYGLSSSATTSLDEAHENANAHVADGLRLPLLVGDDARAPLRVLDAGCGVGGTSFWMARHRAVRMTALTLDPTQIELGEKLSRERHLGGVVTFVLGDYMATGMDEASFDRVFNIESLCHCADLPTYFAHVKHLLVDDGLYGCLEMFRGEGMPQAVAEVMEGWVMPSWPSMAEVELGLRAAGFEDVVTEDLTPQVARSSQQMIAMAKNSQLVMRLAAVVEGTKASDLQEGHVRAAIACSEALLSGGATYGFVRARRARR